MSSYDSTPHASDWLRNALRPLKRRVFISYHHANDQYWYDRMAEHFCETLELFGNRSVTERIDSFIDEYIQRTIREEHIRGSSITIVLCGSETWKRMHVDGEIRSTLYLEHALLGIMLPTLAYEPRYNCRPVPARALRKLYGLRADHRLDMGCDGAGGGDCGCPRPADVDHHQFPAAHGGQPTMSWNWEAVTAAGETFSNWHWGTLIDAGWRDGSLVLELGPLVWMGTVVVGAGTAFRAVLARRRALAENWGFARFEINLPGLKCTVQRNQDTVQLAHRAWVELITRKAALPFDEQHDVITEIYDSWYQLFLEVRRLARDVDACATRKNEGVQKLLEVLTGVLNDGLRPHLTRWQAGFRRWYEVEAAKHPDQSPQEIQRRYEQYSELIEDLKRTNAVLISLAASLRELAHETKGPATGGGGLVQSVPVTRSA